MKTNVLSCFHESKMPKNDFIAWYSSDSNGEKARFCTGLQALINSAKNLPLTG
jgi:hypothetical protein